LDIKPLNVSGEDEDAEGIELQPLEIVEGELNQTVQNASTILPMNLTLSSKNDSIIEIGDVEIEGNDTEVVDNQAIQPLILNQTLLNHSEEAKVVIPGIILPTNENSTEEPESLLIAPLVLNESLDANETEDISSLIASTNLTTLKLDSNKTLDLGNITIDNSTSELQSLFEQEEDIVEQQDSTVGALLIVLALGVLGLAALFAYQFREKMKEGQQTAEASLESDLRERLLSEDLEAPARL